MKKNFTIIITVFMLAFMWTNTYAQETLPTENIYDLSRFDGIIQDINGLMNLPVPKSFFTKNMTEELESGECFHTTFAIDMAEAADYVLVYHNLLPGGQIGQMVISVRFPDGSTRNCLILFQNKDEGYVIPCCENVYAFDLSDELNLLKQEMTGTGDEFRVTLISYEPCSVELRKNNAISEIPAITAPSYLSDNWNTPEYLEYLENYRENRWDVLWNIKYFYNIPYIVSGEGRWSGAGLRNRGSGSANVFVTVYDKDGKKISNSVYPTRTIPENGQESIMISDEVLEGWMQIKSDQPLSGMVNVVGEDGHMLSISLNSDLSEKLYIPHIAQDDQWDTTVIVCNPNYKATTVTLELIDKTGKSIASESYELPAHCRREYRVADFSGQISGSIVISAAGKITAFALSSNLKSGGICYSGMSAVK